MCERSCSEGDRHLCCSSPPAVSSVTQTLSEMDWQRGIWSAALDNDMTRVTRILDADRSLVNLVDTGGYTALHYAAGAGHTGVVSLLLSRGAALDCQTPRQATPLHRAAQRGHTDVVQVLIAAGASTTAVDIDGANVLHRAAAAARTDICRQLLSDRPELRDVRDSRGRRPADICTCQKLRQVLT